MLTAAWWGFVGGAALLIGAVVGIYAHTSQRVIGLIMAFGSGVLISALSFELTKEAYDTAGASSVAIGLGAGAVTFFLGDWVIDKRGGHRRKSPNGPQQGAGASALVLGALLDGIPESAAIGVSLINGGSVGVAVVAAVFLSNIPESLSASAGMTATGRTPRYILGLWSAVLIVSTIAAVAGFGLLKGASPSVTATIQAFAAGAILTMLADTMVPEAVEHAGPTPMSASGSAKEDWQSTMVSESGEVEVDLDLYRASNVGVNEILFQRDGRLWQRLLVHGYG